MQQPPPFSSFTHIRYWPTWIGIFLLFILAWTPFAVRMKAGELLGMLTYWLAKERRYITQVNIALCFPRLSEQEQQALVLKSFRENGIGLIETATGWVRKTGAFKDQTTLIGLDKLEEARDKGKGILLIGAHYSILDFGANLLSLFHPFGVTYRPHRNALFDAFMLRGRLSNCNGVFDRNDIRGAFRHLKKGNTLWYAPDQDYGADHAVFAPFFGHTAATITAASRFAAINNSPTFLVRQHRIEGTPQYEIEFIPFPDSFPGDDDVADACLINTMIEKAIRQYPAQYLWMHKRFKTQPGGKPESPYIDIAAPNHRLTERQYGQVMANAKQLSELDDVKGFRLRPDMWVREYPGVASKRFFNKHPAKQFDRDARMLRLRHISAVTVDNIFRIPSMNISLVSFFMPQGKLLGQLPSRIMPLDALAVWLADLHDKGVSHPNPDADKFMLVDDSFTVVDPTGFTFRDKPLDLKARRQFLVKLSDNLGLTRTESDGFFAAYARAAGLNLVSTRNV